MCGLCGSAGRACGGRGDGAAKGWCPPAGSLRELDNEKAQRLQLLEVRNPGISEVHKWISQNRDQFRGQVGSAAPWGGSALPRTSLPPPLGMRTPFERLQLKCFLATITATYAAMRLVCSADCAPGSSEMPGTPRVVPGARIELILCLVQLLARLLIAPLTCMLSPAGTRQLNFNILLVGRLAAAPRCCGGLRQVLGPIACEVECGDSSHKDMLEQHVPGLPPPPPHPAVPAASSLMRPSRRCVLEVGEACWEMICVASGSPDALHQAAPGDVAL